MSRPQDPNPACQRVQDRLERLMDGGLEPLEAARDEGHLEACAACAAERESWEGFLGLLRRADAPSGTAAGEFRVAERGLVERIDERLQGEARARRVGLQMSFAAAAAALLCVVGFFALAESTPGLPRAGEITKLELQLPPWGDFLSQIGSLGSPR